jgi:drug/metabolite transporter (DMT)-like permease
VQEITINGWSHVLFLAMVSSVFANLVLFTPLERMEASSVTAFIYLIPLSTIVLANIVLGESLTIMSAIGGFAILLGMYLTLKKDGSTKRLETCPAPEM